METDSSVVNPDERSFAGPQDDDWCGHPIGMLAVVVRSPERSLRCGRDDLLKLSLNTEVTSLGP